MGALRHVLRLLADRSQVNLRDTYTQQYHKDGFVIVRDFFNVTELALLTAFIDPIYQQWLAQNKTAYIEQRLVNMHSLTLPEYFDQNPFNRVEFFNALAPSKLTALLADIFKTDIYFHNTQLFFNPYKNQRQPYWHRDLQYSDIDDDTQQQQQSSMLPLHIRIPLIAETGMELVPGTHTRWDTEQERNVRLELNGHHNNEPLPNAVTIKLALGDLLIFNGQMIHRGQYAPNPERKALDICAGKPHPLLSRFLDHQVLPGKEELNAIDNSAWYSPPRP